MVWSDHEAESIRSGAVHLSLECLIHQAFCVMGTVQSLQGLILKGCWRIRLLCFDHLVWDNCRRHKVKIRVRFQSSLHSVVPRLERIIHLHATSRRRWNNCVASLFENFRPLIFLKHHFG